MLERPNIILITTDQQRFDALSCNGSRFIKTPHLDALAKKGVNFQRAYCTNPVCTPSRVSIMTGQYVSRHGSYNIGTRVRDTGGFLSTVLRNEGYRTHHIGKAHFYPWDIESEENRKIESQVPITDFAGFETAELTIGHSDWGVTGHYEQWLKKVGIQKGQGMKELKVKRIFEQDAYGTGDWGMPKKYHSGAFVVDRTKEFLKLHLEKEAQVPFYLNLGFQDPHHPQVLPKDVDKIPKEIFERLQNEESQDHTLEHLNQLGAGEILNGRFAGQYGIAGNQNTKWKEETKNKEKMAIIKSYYYSMVELFDEQIGDLVGFLEENKLLDNTILVFTSDHGDMLGNHQLGEKGPMAYEEVIKVPLLMVGPSYFPQRVSSEVVSLADLYPTLLDYAKVSPKGSLDGISLRSHLELGQAPQRRGVLVQFKEEADAIRYQCMVTKDWKLVEYPREEFGELYNLKDDPKESNNLYNQEKYLGKKYELLKEILFLVEKTDYLAERPCRC